MAFLAALIPALGGAGAAAGTAGAAAGTATAAGTAAAAAGTAATVGSTAGTVVAGSAAGVGASVAAANTAALATMAAPGALSVSSAAGTGTLLSNAALASTLISGYANSKAATDSARMQSALLKQQGKDEMMAAGVQAREERRQARYLSSRARAVAAASGAGALDPTAVNTIAGIEAEGEYRALTAMFNGRTRANTLGMQAGITRDEGRALSNAAWMKAGTTMLNANYGPDWLAKYG